MFLHTDKSYNYMPFYINDEAAIERIKRFHFDSKLKGRGESGFIYYSKTHNVVLKVSPIDISNFYDVCNVHNFRNDICETVVTKRMFNREMKIARQAASIGVGPKFYDTFYTLADSDAHKQVFGQETITIAMTIMERFDMTLQMYAKKYIIDKKIQNKLERIFQKLHDHDIVPNDTHSNNVMINTRTKKIAIVDYGYFRVGFAQKSTYDKALQTLLNELE